MTLVQKLKGCGKAKVKEIQTAAFQKSHREIVHDK
jgi:hypothetical protein